MTTKTTSQPQHDPMALWKKSMDDAFDRFESMQKEATRFESQHIAQATKNVDEMARIWRESLAYSSQLSVEWRKMLMDTQRQSMEMFTSMWAQG